MLTTFVLHGEKVKGNKGVGKALNPQGGLDYVVCVFVGTVDGKEKRKLIPRCVARAAKKVYDENLSPFFESLLEASQDRRCDGYSVNVALNVLDYRGLRYKLEFQVGARKRSDPYKPGIRLLPPPPQDGERLVLDMPFGERVTVVGEFKVHHRFVLQALHNIEKTQSLRMSFATKKDGKVVCEVVEFGTEVMTAKYKVQDKRTKAERVVCRVGDSWWFEDEHEHDKDDKEELVLVFVDVAGKQFRAVGYDKAIDRFKVVEEVLENKQQQPLELYLRHSWFAWMYEAGEQAKPPSYTGTEFEVSCNERGIASALENAMVLCRQTAEFEHDGVKYTAYLVGKMVQQQTAAPSHQRRVFRFRTPFKDDYASVVPVLSQAPSYWRAKRVGERRLMKVKKGEEWDMVQSFVESSVRKHNYVAGFRGLTGKWLEEEEHKNVFGAFHIAEVPQRKPPTLFADALLCQQGGHETMCSAEGVPEEPTVVDGCGNWTGQRGVDVPRGGPQLDEHVPARQTVQCARVQQRQHVWARDVRDRGFCEGPDVLAVQVRGGARGQPHGAEVHMHRTQHNTPARGVFVACFAGQRACAAEPGAVPDALVAWQRRRAHVWDQEGRGGGVVRHTRHGRRNTETC